jgi:PAS domain S-box-containing protein
MVEPQPSLTSSDDSNITDVNECFLNREAGMVLQLADGTIQACNTHAQSILQLTLEQIQSLASFDSIWKAITPDGSPFPGELHPAMVALRTGTCVNTVMGYYRQDGELIWLKINAQPLFCTNGTVPYAVISTFWDITSQYINQQAPFENLSNQVEIEPDFRAIVDHCPNILGQFDKNFRYCYINSAIEVVTGIKPQDFIGKTHEELGMPANFVEYWNTSLQQVFETGKELTIEFDYPNSQGDVRTYQSCLVPKFAVDGSVEYVVGAGADITESKRMEVALRENNELFRLATLAVDGIIFEWNKQTDKVYRSEGLYNLIGVHASEAPANREWWLERINPEDLARLQAQAGSKIAPSDRYEGEYKLRHAFGHWVDVWERGYVLRNEQGEVTSIVGFTTDITQRKQVEASLRASEERFRALVEHAPDAIFISNIEGTFIDVNTSACQLLGYKREELIGKRIVDIILPEEVPRLSAVKASLLQGETHLGEWTLIAKDETHIFVEVNTKLLPDGRWQAFVRDIRDRKAAANEKQLLLTLIDKSADFIGLATMDAKAIFVNTAGQKLVGLDGIEAVNQTAILDYFTPDDCAYLESVIIPTMMRTGHWQGDFRFRHFKTKQPIPVDYSLFIVTHPDTHEQLGIATITRDITERARLEVERNRILQQEQAAREEAQKANRIKDEFLAVLSHELRTPLNPILGWTKLLRSGKCSPEKTSQALEIIERNAQLQTQLIEDLLDVSRILRGKLTLNKSRVNFKQVILAAIETVQLSAQAKSIELSLINFDSHPELQVIGDSSRLQQVFWNLLSNAIKFTPHEGCVTVTLSTVSQSSIQEYAQIQVIDTGKGISPEFLPYIFESFRQEDSTITRKFGGLGLGLAIVRQLVELHGGTVEADSRGLGEGATFTVKIPLQKKLQINTNYNTTSLPDESLPLLGLRVLVVDDEIDSLELVTLILEQYGAEVIGASTSEQALQYFASEQPDVLISDIGMPLMDGYSLMRQIRLQFPKHIIGIALTAYAGDLDQKLALEAGFQRHLTKPIHPIKLVNTIVELNK